MILAMAHHHLGHSEEARAFLAKGTTFANTRMVKHDDLSWNEQIIARVLMREAKVLIPETSASTSETK
jgi:hypothetical protein